MPKGRNLLFSAGLLLLAIAMAYFVWLGLGRSYEHFEMTSERSVFIKAGTYTKGNVVGIQPYVVPADYRTADALYAKLNRYLSIARKNGSFTPATVVVFPEYIGTWLVAVNEKTSVYEAATSSNAMKTVIMCHPLSFANQYLRSDADDKATAAVFALKAEEMAAVYQGVFGRLAREYNATVVAGSIVLPSPEVKGGQLMVGHGPLFNASAVFDMQGQLMEPLIMKRFLVEEEKAFTGVAEQASFPSFVTPAGRLAALVCADSWYEEGYQSLSKQGVDLVMVPSYLVGDDIWNKPWKGYNGGTPPANVSLDDIRSLTEGQAWQKYGLSGRAPASGFQTGINIFLRGRLWDLGTDGHPIILSEGKAEVIEIPADGAAIVNLRF